MSHSSLRMRSGQLIEKHYGLQEIMFLDISDQWKLKFFGSFFFELTFYLFEEQKLSTAMF